MRELAAPYVVAISTLMFCGLTALTLIRTVSHFDPPEADKQPDRVDEEVAV